MLAQTPQPHDATSDTDKTAIIAQQQILISNTIVLVRYLEDQLKLSPPISGPIPVPLPPPAGAQLQAIMDSNTAAIRTQQAYLSNLQDLLVLLPPGP